MTRSTIERETDAKDRFGHLFDLIGDAVVEVEIVDLVPVVRAVNPAFEETFGYDRAEILGESLNEFIVPGDRSEKAEQFDRRTARQEENLAVVSRETTTGTREFLYRGVPYERADGGQYGFAIYTDITDQRRYERHMQVIHRLLRHNLRNDLNVIGGAAEHVATTTDDAEIADLAATIRGRARALSSLGEEMKAIEHLLVEEREPTPVDVAALCREVAAGANADAGAATVSVDAPPVAPALGLQELRAAIEALVDNALTHGGAEPTVRLEVAQEGEHVTVAVADDGPGIPEPDRAPVFRDADITQLQHGSGIGLWLVRWTVEACGGYIEYERADGWTVVRLGLRATDGAEPADGA